ncbi:MAG: hypothetical protein ABIG29_00135 [Candidatus Nealsonbacteria bacterium]
MNKEFILKLKNICNAFLKGLAGNLLPAVAILFLVVLVLGALVFYRYDILVRTSQSNSIGGTVQFQKELYQQILKEWQTRDKRFAAADAQSYIDPFQENREKPAPVEPEEPKVISVDSKLLSAVNLLEFYALKGEKIPLLSYRTKMWQEFGLGSAQSYIGSVYQNQQLLAELKKRLTE